MLCRFKYVAVSQLIVVVKKALAFLFAVVVKHFPSSFMLLLYPHNNCEDGVSDSILFIQLILDINLQCLYTTNRTRRLKHFQLNINQCRCYCN